MMHHTAAYGVWHCVGGCTAARADNDVVGGLHGLPASVGSSWYAQASLQGGAHRKAGGVDSVPADAQRPGVP